MDRGVVVVVVFVVAAATSEARSIGVFKLVFTHARATGLLLFVLSKGLSAL